ncbi:hypothetical protein GH714_007853 [Hevea brasiliensis]|uniref:Tubulin/FtsZ GTPase domain-containing protein n=1 Tax=Hevea brasiliensis TaxID=3981 RepID=A0A6A6M1D2_HEVBR|nr:hypothetical protein GH714_007853 [Hevea brasiliensis]
MSSVEKDGDYNGVSFLGNSQFVEVIGIGSRMDAVLDFCLDSPFQLSSSLRFWNINVKDPLNVQLQERIPGKDLNPRVLEASQFLRSCSTAIILVASAGYGLDHVTAIDLLKTVRCRNGFAVSIFLRPFSFEGQRRQDEVKNLAGKLQDHTNFCIDIDTDTLLNKDLVTLDEALKSANSAVLLAINAISVLISETHQKLICILHNSVKELKVSEVMKILESHKEAKIGFGAGNSIESSIIQALYDCPFMGAGIENLNGIIICIVASSGRHGQQPDDIEGINGIDEHSEEHEMLPNSKCNDIYSSRSYGSEAKENEIGLLDGRNNSSDFYDQLAEETPTLHREPPVSWNLGPGYQIAQEWARERTGATSVLDTLSIFRLPVGVRHPEESKEGLNISYAAELPELKTEGDDKEQKHVNSGISSWGALTDAGFVLVRDFYNNASTMLKGRNADVPKKQGVLSVRAASMLEAERDSPKKWSPVMEMQYRGGVYRGRCQGGLPEGKGRLILGGGSIYDGMWRYGKRSGLGAFYFSNGDVFQGSWRDDVMHGKGWFISTLETDGLQTFGREKPMVKAVSIQSLVKSFLVNSKMDGDMATFFALMLMEQGQYSLS